MTLSLFDEGWLKPATLTEAPASAVVLVTEPEAPPTFSAEDLGIADLESDEVSPVTLRVGEAAFEVLGDFDTFNGPERLAVVVDGEDRYELSPRARQWVDLRAVRAKEEAERAALEDRRAWLRGLCPVQYLESPATRRWLEAVYTRGFGYGTELVEEFARDFGSSMAAEEWHAGVLYMAWQGSQLAPNAATWPADVVRMLGAATPENAGDAKRAAWLVLDRLRLESWVTEDMDGALPPRRADERGSSVLWRYEPQIDEARWATFPDWLTRIRERCPWGVTNVRRRRTG